MGSQTTFRVGDVFDADDVRARWVATLALIWNELALRNQRLVVGLTSDAHPHENLHDARLLVSTVWEATKYLRDTRAEPAVKTFIDELPAASLVDLDAALEATGATASDSTFKRRQAAMRDLSSHFPELERKHVSRALKKIADEEGLIVTGDNFLDARLDFADQLAVNLVFDAPPKTWVSEFKDFVATLAEVVVPLMRFLQTAIGIHLTQHKDALTVTSSK